MENQDKPLEFHILVNKKYYYTSQDVIEDIELVEAAKLRLKEKSRCIRVELDDL